MNFIDTLNHRLFQNLILLGDHFYELLETDLQTKKEELELLHKNPVVMFPILRTLKSMKDPLMTIPNSSDELIISEILEEYKKTMVNLWNDIIDKYRFRINDQKCNQLTDDFKTAIENINFVDIQKVFKELNTLVDYD